MRKVLGVSLILIFLPVSVCFGVVGQAEGFLIGAENGVLLASGPAGSADSTNIAAVGHNQRSTDRYNFVTALQSENAMLVQGAYAAGLTGGFAVGQTANALGGQLQAVGGGGLGIQDQLLKANFDQYVANIGGGIGAALGIQAFAGLQVQLIISPYGASTNVQYLGLGQVDKVGGGP